MEECALSMGQRSNDAAVKDAQIKLSKEDYAKGTGQRYQLSLLSAGYVMKHKLPQVTQLTPPLLLLPPLPPLLPRVVVGKVRLRKRGRGNRPKEMMVIR
jgi:hypothetical protein